MCVTYCPKNRVYPSKSTLQKICHKSFAIFSLSLIFCEIPPGAKFVYFGYMFESVYVYVGGGGEWVRQWQGWGIEGNNLCWCVSKNAVRECQAIKEYDELYAKKTTPKYIFCTKKLKIHKMFSTTTTTATKQAKSLNCEPQVFDSPSLSARVCVCVCVYLPRSYSI